MSVTGKPVAIPLLIGQGVSAPIMSFANEAKDADNHRRIRRWIDGRKIRSPRGPVRQKRPSDT